jgi:hypothetical protein
MSTQRRLFLGIALVAVAALLPATAGTTSAKALHCKKGYVKKTVTKHGKKVTVCRKKAAANVPADGVYEGDPYHSIVAQVSGHGQKVTVVGQISGPNQHCASGKPGGTVTIRIDNAAISKTGAFNSPGADPDGTFQGSIHGTLTKARGGDAHINMVVAVNNSPAVDDTGEPNGATCTGSQTWNITLVKRHA